MRYYIELIHINTLRRRCCRLRRAREHRANNPNSHAVHDFFHRATLCVSAVFAVVRCPSVSLTCWCIVSTRLKISSNFFLDPVARVRIGPERTGTAFRFFFLNRNGVPVHFFENSERNSDSCCCVHTSVLPSVTVLKLRLGIEIAINDTSACLLIITF